MSKGRHQSPRTWDEANILLRRLAHETPEQREQWMIEEMVSLAKDMARDAAARYAPDGRLHADKARELHELFFEGVRRYMPVQDQARHERVVAQARARLGLPTEPPGKG